MASARSMKVENFSTVKLGGRHSGCDSFAGILAMLGSNEVVTVPNGRV